MMDTKVTSASNDHTTRKRAIVMGRESARRPHWRFLRLCLIAMICAFIWNTYIFQPLWRHLSSRFNSTSPPFSNESQTTPAQTTANTTLIPLEAHIMSKCPDARDCLVDLVVPAMEQVVDKVEFRLSYIGTTGDDGNVECMHGPDECLGNMLSLCAQQLFPDDAKRSLGFTTCMIMKYPDIPQRELVEQCSLEHGINFEDINGCISDEGRGTGLLEESVKRSKEAGVTKSCTVRLADKIWCVRDGGQWKNCSQGHDPSDLADAVKEIVHKDS